MSHLDTQMQMHMRLFRAQRNFYIAGWVSISRPFFRTKFPQHRPCQVRPLPLPGDQAPSRLDQRQCWAPGMRDFTHLKYIQNLRSYLHPNIIKISGGFGAENQIWLILAPPITTYHLPIATSQILLKTATVVIEGHYSWHHWIDKKVDLRLYLASMVMELTVYFFFFSGFPSSSFFGFFPFLFASSVRSQTSLGLKLTSASTAN